jgi:hypothetical protein
MNRRVANRRSGEEEESGKMGLIGDSGNQEWGEGFEVS